MPNINNKLYPELNAANMRSINEHTFIPNGRSVGFLRGPAWIDQSVKMIVQQPKTWLSIIAILVGLEFIDANLPQASLLSFLVLILETILFAGIMCVAQSQRLTGVADLSLITSGFTNRTGAIIGTIAIKILILMIGIAIAFILMSVAAIPYSQQLTDAFQAHDVILLIDALDRIGPGIIALVVMVAIAAFIISEMLTVFSIPLIILNKMPFSQALSTSFRASLKNVLPAIAYLISVLIVIGPLSAVELFVWPNNIYFGLIYCVITFGLIGLPVYAAYCNIFTDSERL